MERLTIKEDDGSYTLRGMCEINSSGKIVSSNLCTEVCAEAQECERCPIQGGFERLAKYENTGLTPERIIEHDQEYTKMCKELSEYKELEKKGLLLRLPCKVGDTVYWVNNHYRTYGDYKVDNETVREFTLNEEELIVFMGGPKLGLWGKTIFLTRKEAEEKLKEMEEGNAIN